MYESKIMAPVSLDGRHLSCIHQQQQQKKKGSIRKQKLKRDFILKSDSKNYDHFAAPV